MQSLLNDEFVPITSKIGFFESNLQEVVAAYLAWQRPLQSKRNVSFDENMVKGDLASVLLKLEPLTTVEPRRMLFVPTQGQWTAMFDNSHRGLDEAPVAYLSRFMRCRAVRMVAVPNSLADESKSAKGRYGATIFSLFSPEAEQQFNRLRTVYAANDGGKWEFKASGVSQSFEDTKQYDSKKIADRFTPEMLNNYLKALGIRAFDEDFYRAGDGAMMVEKIGPQAPTLKMFSIKEVQSTF